MTLLKDRDCVARKDCKCIWCGEGIAKGDPKHVQSGRWDGEFQSNNYHPECYSAMLELCRLEGGELEFFDAGAFARGTILDKFDSAIAGKPSSCFGRSSPN